VFCRKIDFHQSANTCFSFCRNVVAKCRIVEMSKLFCRMSKCRNCFVECRNVELFDKNNSLDISTKNVELSTFDIFSTFDILYSLLVFASHRKITTLFSQKRHMYNLCSDIEIDSSYTSLQLIVKTIQYFYM
jgi:hypothetical protein